MKQVKYLIVGQGLAGSLLSWEMEKKGWDYHVIDRGTPWTSSNKAAGIYNPVTGRKMVLTWMANDLFTGLEEYYHELEKRLGQKIIHPKPMYRPFVSVEEQNDWHSKAILSDYKPFIQSIKSKSMGIGGLIDPHGGVLLAKTGYVDVPALLKYFKTYLLSKNRLTIADFGAHALQFEAGQVGYQHLKAEKVIFCEGAEATVSNFWGYLPFRPVKGEIIEIEANFPDDFIVNRHVFVVPKEHTFMVGSTYDHKQLDYKSSEAGIRNIESRLKKILNIQYTIKNQWAGVRPATYDRRPFLGVHPDRPQVGIFNGFGAKGVSLIPFFASEFVNFLSGNHLLTPEVDVVRVLRK